MRKSLSLCLYLFRQRVSYEEQLTALDHQREEERSSRSQHHDMMVQVLGGREGGKEGGGEGRKEGRRGGEGRREEGLSGKIIGSITSLTSLTLPTFISGDQECFHVSTA